MGLDGNPVKDASGALSFWPNPAAHPEGAIGFLEARGASRDHRPTGLRTRLRAQDVLRMSADTNGSAGIWAMPMMRQHSWSPMGHAQGHTDAAGNLFGQASPALGHRPTAHVGGGSSLAPAALSQAQYAAAAPAMSLQDRLQRPSPTPTPGDGAHMKMMDGPSQSPCRVQWADGRGLDTTWNDASTALGAMNTEDADSDSSSGSSSGSGSGLPFTFEQALHPF